ncbi:MAG: peptidoglycan-binding protein [Actinomycetota bacterium]|nr:peptidoglycan-binding protein [Actinomycetota bacterium]
MRAGRLAAAASLATLVLAAPAGAKINPQTAGLQVALRAWGYYCGPIDAIAGPMTARAVRELQRRHGLVVDGIPGPATRRAMGRLGRPLYGRRTLRRGMAGWDVSVLQFLLTRRRASTGIIDGYFGAETSRALRRFQRRVGLVADAIAGPLTRRAL